jgi:hypothetical protein
MTNQKGALETVELRRGRYRSDSAKLWEKACSRFVGRSLFVLEILLWKLKVPVALRVLLRTRFFG